MDWLLTNWVDVVQVITYVGAIASIVVRITPTTVDNAILDKVIGLLNFLALNKPR